MSMFCFQCQETAGGTGCTKAGVCGKTDVTANLQDLLIHNLKGLSALLRRSELEGKIKEKDRKDLLIFITESLFSTITNANFDVAYFENQIRRAVEAKGELIRLGGLSSRDLSDAEAWEGSTSGELELKAAGLRISEAPDQDLQSLRELTIYGVKGMAAYAHHAHVLGFDDQEVYDFMAEALERTLDESLDLNALLALVLKTGEYGVRVMELLDRANTGTYGHPEPTRVNIGTRNNPGILITGHDLKDLEELLAQTEGTGVDVYTHGEMLPAHYYPAFKKYPHFAGNYGNAWWKQKEEFESFNGPILFTTNCLVPPPAAYRDRVYTTGVVRFQGCPNIPDREEGKAKDFSTLIARALTCPPPSQIESGEITGGFAHHTVLSIADKVIRAVQEGDIRKFVVMAGCDGRQKGRSYYTEFAEKLPGDTVILTAGCAKFRYNKLNLGEIGGIPRVLDAGQCNDSYSLARIALELAKALNTGVNDLPIVYNIAWYEQKAVIVLLALLSLGVKNIHLGPTLPAFLSHNVVKVLVENFGIAGIGTVEEDLALLIG